MCAIESASKHATKAISASAPGSSDEGDFARSRTSTSSWAEASDNSNRASYGFPSRQKWPPKASSVLIPLIAQMLNGNFRIFSCQPQQTIFYHHMAKSPLFTGRYRVDQISRPERIYIGNWRQAWANPSSARVWRQSRHRIRKLS